MTRFSYFMTHLGHHQTRIFEYQLIKRELRGTTGYLACSPVGFSSLSAILEALAENPLDVFLHKHALENLGTADPEFINTLLMTDDRRGPVTNVLCAEWLRSTSDSGTPLARYLSKFFTDQDFWNPELSPLAILAQRYPAATQNSTLGEDFKNNLETGAPLPTSTAKRIWTMTLPSPGNLEPDRDFLENAHENIRRAMPAVHPDPPPEQACLLAEDALRRNGLGCNQEFRHEASLSPVALLRDWPVEFSIALPDRIRHVSGQLTSFGRGLSLAQARTSLRMEIIERASAFPQLEYVNGVLVAAGLQREATLQQASIAELRKKKIPFFAPAPDFLLERYQNSRFYWFPGETPSDDSIWAPAQAVFLFCNLDEPAIFDRAGSTGLGAGITIAQAKLSALLETLERDAAATTPILPSRFVRIATRDKLLASLLDDYHARGIFPIFQDITTEIGLPAWRCIVIDPAGGLVHASAAGLSSKKAIISSLTETPWPYSWAKPAPYGKKSRRAPPETPLIYLEDLPDYDLGSAESNLAFLEKVLNHLSIKPAFYDLERKDLAIPVIRAFLPGLETHAEFDETYEPSVRLMARWKKQTTMNETPYEQP